MSDKGVSSILEDVAKEGLLSKHKVGRNNEYSVDLRAVFRHEAQPGQSLAEFAVWLAELYNGAAMELPRSSAEITIDWLHHVLGDALGGSRITGVEREVIGHNVGFVGELTRLTLAYAGPAPNAPPSVIAKLPTGDETVRMMAQLFGFYEREVRFYSELQGEVAVRTPRCFFSAADVAAGRFVLLLEDLAPGRCGDQLASCTPAEAELALTELARFQAAWWNSSRLDAFDWLATTADPVVRQVLQAIYKQSWPNFEQEFSNLLPPEVFTTGKRFGDSLPALWDAVSQRPATLLHTDFRLDNMFFDLADGSPFALIDWQLVQRGPGPSDVTYFLAGSFAPEVRRECEMDLLRVYHAALLQHGVQEYGFDECLYDYRMAALAFYIFLVTGRENVDMSKYEGRGQTLLDSMVERYTTAILDLGAAEFLPN